MVEAILVRELREFKARLGLGDEPALERELLMLLRRVAVIFAILVADLPDEDIT